MATNYYPPGVVIPVYVVFTVVGLVLTGLRFWARISYTRTRVGPDDWLMAAAMVIACACTGIQIYNAEFGTGGAAVTDKDQADKIVRSNKINLSMTIIEKPAFTFIKLSILFFYRRIFSVWPSFRRINIFLIIFISIWGLAFMLGDILVCGSRISLQIAADPKPAAEYCGDRGLMLLLFAVTSVMTDLMVIGLPLFYIGKLQMPASKKWAAAGVFLLGFLSVLAGILRTAFLGVAWPAGRMGWAYKAPPGGKTPYVLQIFNPTFMVMIELLLATWSGNLPPLSTIFAGFFGVVYRKLSQTYGSFSTGSRSRRRSSDQSESRDPTITWGSSEKKNDPSDSDSLNYHSSLDKRRVSHDDYHSALGRSRVSRDDYHMP